MNMRIQVFAIVGSILIAVFIFELIRKRKLLERYSLLWFGSALVMIILSLWRDLLTKVSVLMGVYYAPSALFIIAMFCGVALSLHFTIAISKLSAQNKALAQEIALLQNTLQQNEKNNTE